MSLLPRALPVQSLLTLCFLSHSQVGKTAELTATFAPVSGDSYNLAANWDITQVPLNNVTDQFNVIIPANLAALFDVDPVSEINDFTLGSNSTFTVPGGHSLTVLDDTSISGTLIADSTSALFQATGAGADFAPGGARLMAIGGGTVRIAATTFTNTSLGGNSTQFSADGTGSLLDLSSLTSYTDSINSNGARRVVASNNGVIDLSNVGTVTEFNAGSIEFEVASGGDIDLGGLTTVNGNVTLDIDNPSYTLPSLTTASGLVVDLANGSTFTANAMTDFVSSAVVFSGDNPGIFQASSVNKFTNSSVNLAPGQQFNIAPGGLTDVDSASISVRGGAQFGSTQIVATTFTNTSLGGNSTQFSADGTGSLLDLSSLTSYTDSINSNGARRVVASNNGVIDLSNVGTVTEFNAGSIEFEVASGGDIDLGGLTTVNGNVTLDIDNPSYTLPSLTTASGLVVDLANGSTFTANAMTDFVSSAVVFSGDNPGIFQASSVNKFTNSSVNLAPGQQFNIAPGGLTDVDSASISVRGGAQFGSTQIVATTFTNTSLGGNSTQFSADGTGSLLDLSSLTSYTDSINSNGARRVVASNNGVIDLSNVGTVTEFNAGSIEFEVASGGDIDLGGLTTVNGNVTLDIDNPSYTLPSLTTASGLVVDLANGSTFTANAMTDFVSSAVVFSGDNPGIFQASSVNKFTNSSVNLAPGQQFNIAPGGLTDVDSASISVRGGAQFGSTQIVATTFTNTSLGGNSTQFSADGTGSLLDLSSLTSYTDSINSNGARRVVASNNGVIDLSNVGTVTEFNAGSVSFESESGGLIKFGSINATGNVAIAADGAQSRLEVVNGINLSSSVSLILTDAATLQLGKDLIYSTTVESQLNLDAGIVEIQGSQSTFLEVGGEDLGVAGDPTGNFGIGKLVIGETGAPTMTFLTDLVDNGNRAGNNRESLYLLGFGGPDGLELIDGSMLVLGDINTYALVSGSMVHLNSLFSVGVNTVPFLGGSISQTFPADFDQNAAVDADDFAIWSSNYGTLSGASFTDGDADKDGDVDGNDFLLWQKFTGGSLGAAAASVAVPEPASMVLLTILLGFTCCRNRHSDRVECF